MALQPIDLGNGILLFKNVLKDPKKVYKFILDSKNNMNDPYFNEKGWYPWPPWGNYIKNYPNLSSDYEKDNSYGAEIQKECINVFFEILKIYKESFFDNNYFEKYNFPKNLPESIEELRKNRSEGNMDYNIADFVLFETNKNVEEDWQMKIHQDVMFWWGGGRHLFNFNIYINDDYEGGEILFFKTDGVEKTKYIDSHSGKEGEALLVEDFFIYKMQAGDGLIFPTDLQHGVLPIKNNGEKYYIRQFITADHSDEYKFYSKKYPNLEDFESFYNESKKEYDSLRETPILFDSVDNIDLDSPKYSYMIEKKIPCVIKTYKDISFV
jgi:hypothetical protein